MKKHKIDKTQFYNFIFGTIFVIGFLLLIYPWIANIINQHQQSLAISTYQQIIEQSDDQIYEEELKKAYEYNQHIDQYPSLSEAYHFENKSDDAVYNSLLNLGGMEIMGILRIPVIDVELPIYHGTDAAVLQVGVGHLKGSSLPVGGKSTHSVITGHTGLPSSKLLSDADQLEKGDIFYIDVLKQTLAYEVTDVRSVLPDDTESLNIVEGEDLCTIVTCTPYGINTHRLLVTGKRIAYVDMSKELNDEVLKIPVRLILLVIWIILFIIYIIIYQKRKRHI